MMTKKRHNKQTLNEAIKVLLRQEKIGTQEEIVAILRDQGYDVNQSKVSRMLRKLMATKLKSDSGKTVYALPKEPAPPSTKATLLHLVLDVSANENLVVIQTSPGSASLIARMLDYHEAESTILGTLAGDDTIFIAPKSVKDIQKTLNEVKQLLANV